MNTSVKLAQELKIAADMGAMSVNEVLSILEDDKMKKVAEEQLTFYYSLAIRANEIIEECGCEAKSKPISGYITKAMIKINTMIDDTTSKIAELMINGTVMGVISIHKIYNKAKNTLSQEVKTLAEETLGKFNGYIENLKAYL